MGLIKHSEEYFPLERRGSYKLDGQDLFVPAVVVVDGNGNAASAATPLPVAPSSSGYKATATFTPAAAAYLANDIMEGAKQLANIGPAAGGEVRVETVELEVDHTAVIAGETSYRLYLYSVTPPSALADNAAWDLPSGDRASFRGYVDLGSPVDLGSTLYVKSVADGTHLTVPAGGSLFGYLVTNGGFTATAAARKVTLHTVAL